MNFILKYLIMYDIIYNRDDDMKKKIIGLLLIFVFSMFLTGCKNNYTPVPSNKFLSVFKNKEKYQVIDKTKIETGIYKKSYEVGNGNITFYYLEFSTVKDARNYMRLSYKNKNFHFNSNKKYIVAKRKLSKLYIKAIQVDKMIVIGMSNKFFDRFKVNKIFNEMDL